MLSIVRAIIVHRDFPRLPGGECTHREFPAKNALCGPDEFLFGCQTVGPYCLATQKWHHNPSTNSRQMLEKQLRVEQATTGVVWGVYISQ